VIFFVLVVLLHSGEEQKWIGDAINAVCGEDGDENKKTREERHESTSTWMRIVRLFMRPTTCMDAIAYTGVSSLWFHRKHSRCPYPLVVTRTTLSIISLVMIYPYQ
jgi:hypothetical protein